MPLTIKDGDGQMMTVRKIYSDRQAMSVLYRGGIFYRLPRDASSLAGNGARKSGTRLGNDGSVVEHLLATIGMSALLLALGGY
jgi:hypothetical protein